MLIHEQLNDQKKMSEIDQQIANFFLENPRELKQLSARKLAEKMYVAPSTISRFCQKIGYVGYNEFKEAYIEEYNYLQSHFKEIDPNRPFTPKDTVWTIANKIGQLYEETIADTLSLLNYEILEQTTNQLRKSKKVYVYSAGDHLDLANNFKHKMVRIGKNIEVVGRSDLVYYYAGHAEKEDCFLLISYSGETNDVLRILKTLKKKKLNTIAVTSYGENTLSKFADITLNISTREKLIRNLGSFSSDLSVMYLLDVLYASYFSKDYLKQFEQKAKIAESYQTFRSSDNPLLKD